MDAEEHLMKNVQPGMNVAKQRRKIASLLDEHSTPSQQLFVLHLVGLFNASVEEGQPRPASEFIPMYLEEFGL
jgi:hypothetical protein